MTIQNPFTTARETRGITKTIRLTPSESRAIQEIADRERVEFADLAREALGLLVENRNQSKTGERP